MSHIHRTGTPLPRPRRRYVAVLVSGLLLAGGLVAAAGPATASVPVRVLDVTAHDNCDQTPACGDWYDLSSHTLTAGLIDVRLHNAGHVDHQVQFVRLHEGFDAASYMADLIGSGGGSALRDGDAMGGSNAVGAGQDQETWVNLPAGNYVAMCFQDGPPNSGPPHLFKGMYDSFTVTGQGNSAHPPVPVRGTISAYSFGFNLPATIDGHGVYRFVNTASADSHELTLLKLAPGMHAQDVLSWLADPASGPPPFSSAGGFGALAPGGQGWVRLDLAAGDYVAVCFVPDDEAPHLPHIELGMHVEFSVAG